MNSMQKDTNYADSFEFPGIHSIRIYGYSKPLEHHNPKLGTLYDDSLISTSIMFDLSVLSREYVSSLSTLVLYVIVGPLRDRLKMVTSQCRINRV
mgnify:CR=1 FL=1